MQKDQKLKVFLGYIENSRPVGTHETLSKKIVFMLTWWYMSLFPAPRRQKQADCYEFKASLVYIVSSRTAKAT